MDPIPSKTDSQGTLLMSSFSSLKSTLPMSRVEVLLAGFLLSPTFCNSITLWSLRPTQPPITTLPTSPTLFTNNRSRRAPFLVSFYTTCTKKLSSACLRSVLAEGRISQSMLLKETSILRRKSSCQRLR